MKRISRIDRSIDLLRTRTTTRMQPPHLCSACKRQSTSFSTSSLRAAQPETKIPLTDKLRRKIWGTDNPPGLEDPYGNQSVFDQTKKRAKEAEVEVKETARTPVDLGSYQPAHSWEELNWVGEEVEPTYAFNGFLPREVLKDPEQITAALHRAMVEVFSLQEAGKSLHEVSVASPHDDFTDDVQLRPSATGATMEFFGDASLQKVVESLAVPALNETNDDTKPTESEEDIVADRSELDPLHEGTVPTTDPATHPKNVPTESEEDIDADKSPQDPLAEAGSHRTYQEVIASWDPAWLQVSLEDPEVKFAVLKRTLQLTGIPISDSIIKSINTAQSLLNRLIAPPKPRKLVEALAQKEELVTLPNVSIYPQRISFVAKENSVGRWKIIKKKLEAQGLPVY